MEVAALIISILSLLISILFAVLEIRNTKKINDINLEAELSKDIIKEYLTEKFIISYLYKILCYIEIIDTSLLFKSINKDKSSVACFFNPITK